MDSKRFPSFQHSRNLPARVGRQTFHVASWEKIAAISCIRKKYSPSSFLKRKKREKRTERLFEVGRGNKNWRFSRSEHSIRSRRAAHGARRSWKTGKAVNETITAPARSHQAAASPFFPRRNAASVFARRALRRKVKSCLQTGRWERKKEGRERYSQRREERDREREKEKCKGGTSAAEGWNLRVGTIVG